MPKFRILSPDEIDPPGRSRKRPEPPPAAPLPVLASISLDGIHAHTSPESFARGQEYAARGAVATLTLRGAQLFARVWGSEEQPYHVQVLLGPAGVAQASCSCPYDWGGWCKHIVATLLVVMQSPQSIEQRPTLEALLDTLDQAALRAVLQRLVEDDPGLIEAIEHAATGARAGTSGPALPAANAPPVDTRALARQVRAILHPRYSGYGYAFGAASSLRALLAPIQARIEAGDATGALAALEAFTAAYVAEWFELDDSDGDPGDLFNDLADLWAEAVLSANLSATERHTWHRRLSAWRAEADAYGAGDPFALAESAAEHGWETPWLAKVLAGDQPGATVQPYEPEELIPIRLRVLERRGQTEAYLRLAAATGQARSLALKLAVLGRIAQARAVALRDLANPSETLEVAQALHARGATAEALEVAEHGLALAGSHALLGDWLADLAVSQNQPALALRATEAALRSEPNLARYQRLEALAGDSWPEIHARALAAVRQAGWLHTAGQVDILLHEGRIDDAIAVVDNTASRELARVVEAAATTRPDWAIQVATRAAAAIIEPGDAAHYDTAVAWLRSARDAYRAAGRPSEWQAYLADLRARHGRKHKLMALLSRMG